ncbi:MAG: CoA-binding protein, partial [bacterium]|nr:CoA-binding protein [bacterium]
MHKEGIKGYSYYVGINSLSEIATPEDRVCILNILGNESRTVSPTSHEYSNGNIVFGTGPGRSGQTLDTQLGPIPVYNSVREGIEAGHKFNTGVVYLPPAGVKDGVAEMVRQNPDLKKVIILTEKISVKDSRTIRAICQINGIDVFGGNCLGVADAWNHIRIGGALGGTDPEESLVKGSIAIYSNSGNFTTTIATYLQTQGWGTTTSISSGKDVYIHYATPEFLHALGNDNRSKASVLYIEPGGYYEHNLNITKPTVACIVGRWKAKLTRACGHAGSLAGSGDDAAAKEQWFMDYFGVNSIYTPENPVVSKKGAVVTNISYIPAALTKVMELNHIKPDFEPRGNLSLKCWFGNNQGLRLPSDLGIPIVEAMPPYDVQIRILDLRIGAQIARQTLKDASGASMMDPKTQISRLYNHSILETSRYSLEENLLLALTRSLPEPSARKLANIVFHSDLNLFGDVMLAAADASRASGSSPNCALSAALGILGKGRVEKSQAILGLLLERFINQNLITGDENPDYSEILKNLEDDQRLSMVREGQDPLAASMLQAIES